MTQPLPASGRQLYVAVLTCDIASMKDQLERGADPNHKDPQNNTALHIALYRGLSFEIIRLLIEKGAGIEISGNNGDTAIIIAAQKNNLEALELLINKGANLARKDRLMNRTALEWAVATMNPQAEKILRAAHMLQQQQGEVKTRTTASHISSTASQTGILANRQQTTVRARPTC